MSHPTNKQIKAGNDIASLLYDASCAKALGHAFPPHPKYQLLISSYLIGEIDSVTAIYMAMHGET